MPADASASRAELQFRRRRGRIAIEQFAFEVAAAIQKQPFDEKMWQRLWRATR